MLKRFIWAIVVLYFAILLGQKDLLADVGESSRNENSVIYPSIRDTQRGHLDEPWGAREEPPGYREEPIGFMEVPPGHSSKPTGFRETPPGHSEEPAGFRSQNPLLSTRDDFIIPITDRQSEVITDDLKETPPNFHQRPNNDSPTSGLRETYSRLE